MKEPILHPISIESVQLKKGKPDIRYLKAPRIERGDDVVFHLSKTKRELYRWRFALEEGCIVTCGDSSYEVIEVHHFGNKSIQVILITNRIDTRDSDVDRLRKNLKYID